MTGPLDQLETIRVSGLVDGRDEMEMTVTVSISVQKLVGGTICTYSVGEFEVSILTCRQHIETMTVFLSKWASLFVIYSLECFIYLATCGILFTPNDLLATNHLQLHWFTYNANFHQYKLGIVHQHIGVIWPFA